VLLNTAYVKLTCQATTSERRMKLFVYKLLRPVGSHSLMLWKT